MQDERISAYLDGELSPGERAEMEELLRTSSSHQQVLAELTSIRESLQSLPHYTLLRCAIRYVCCSYLSTRIGT